MRPYPLFFPPLALFVLFFFSSSCNNKQSTITNVPVSKQQKFGKFEFEESLYDFGLIKEGDTVSHNFNYTNIGDAPLVIHDISTGCGCTVAEYPKSAVPVQGKASIRVQFSKRHDPGIHNKAIIIRANTEDNYTVIHIEANVAQ